ncbi:MAG TPA: four helix bundle protein [Phycisphaerales bacterium]|nr:four helix bundle protein [Phycisphaerales bacterium]
MGGVRRFEDLVAWQRARELTRVVYVATAEGTLARDFGLRDQMRRASVSIMANIAEGFDRSRAGEFHQFLSVAKASCAELRSHVYVALDAQHLSPDRADEIMRLAEQTSRVVSGLRTLVARTRTKPRSTQPFQH